MDDVGCLLLKVIGSLVLDVVGLVCCTGLLEGGPGESWVGTASVFDIVSPTEVKAEHADPE